jgi:hypothetical protein
VELSVALTAAPTQAPTLLCADGDWGVALGAGVGRGRRSQRAAAVPGDPRAEAGEGLAEEGLERRTRENDWHKWWLPSKVIVVCKVCDYICSFSVQVVCGDF